MTSYKNGYGTKAPAGSLAPMDSTIDGSKWHHGVDALGIAKLTKISGEINSIVDETSVSVAKAQIKVGRLLNDARLLIPGDLQFGKWREANTSITNKSTANKLMNLAAQVGDGRITQEMLDILPLSTLKELISAPDAVLASVQQKVLEGEVVPRSDIRGAGKTEPVPVERTPEAVEHSGPGESAGSPAELVGEPERKPTIKTPVSPAAPKINVGGVAERTIRLSLSERLRKLNPDIPPPFPGCKPIEWAWMLFGMDIDPAILPNIAVVETLREHYLECVTDSNIVDTDIIDKSVIEWAAIVDRAYTIITEEY